MRTNDARRRIVYDPEADVLSWEMSDKPIDYAKEIGGVIVHFSGNHIPVLIEVLEAGRFLAKSKKLYKEEGGMPIKGAAPAVQ